MFEQLFVPSVARARTSVRQSGVAPLGVEAQADLDAQLLRRLVGVSRRCLEARLAGYRAERQSSLDRILSQATGDDPHLEAYLAAEAEDDLDDLHSRFPELARLHAQIVRDWTDATIELHRRFTDDAPLLRELVGGDGPVYVVRVQTDLSDPHHHARTVSTLELSDGRRVVYKPRSLAMEAGFARLVSWLNDDHHLPLKLRPMGALDRTTHGWCEYVAPRPCADESERRRYARRCGMLLALAHVFDITDLHVENLVGSGEHPVLVDLETLMASRMPTSFSDDPLDGATRLLKEQLADSVLRTAMLPQWQVGSAGQALDVSALAPSETDSTMSDHADEIVAGFAQTCNSLLRRRADLLAPEGPLRGFAAHSTRIVVRHTRVYAALTGESLQMACMRDADRRSRTVQRLRAATDRNPGNHVIASIVDSEISAVQRLDVPIFAARADSRDLILDDGATLPDVFEVSGFHRTLTRIRELDDADVQRQIGHIRAAFAARDEQEPLTLTSAVRASAHSVPDGEQLLAAAAGIARELERRATVAADGSMGWIGLQRDPELGLRRVAPTGDDLYGGTAGIALFFAAYARLGRSREHADMARAILRGAVEHTTGSGPDSPRRGLGLGQGTASLIHAVVTTAHLLQDDSLLRDAQVLAAMVTSNRIEGDDVLDVLGGSAGTLLALVSLYEQAGGEGILQRARECADHLLGSRRTGEDGRRTWRAANGTLTVGFPHGASGIAHALLRLFALTGNIDLRDAALAGLHAERSSYAPELRNWRSRPDVPPEVPVMTRWCQGAPGIALGRLSAVALAEDRELEHDLEIALETTAGYPYARLDLDGVCCGNAGRIDVLLTAARALDRPELARTARTMAGEVVTGAADEGGFRCFGVSGAGFFEPSLFSGVAGIGYTFLRCASPVDIPPLVTFAPDAGGSK